MEDLSALAITWIAVFAAHFAAEKTKLTPVLWFLAMGCILVNLGILPEEPGIFMRDFAEIGIIVIMFALGFEENSSEFIRSVKRSWGIALFGAIAPFTVTYVLVMHFWGDRNGALMCGLAMTATAVSLTIHEDTRRIIDSIAFSWIGPVFFIVLGTHLVLDMEVLMSVLDETLALFLGLFLAQVLSAGLAFVVMDIAYVQHRIINEQMFYTLMFTAFALNVAVPLAIRWWKPRFLRSVESPP